MSTVALSRSATSIYTRPRSTIGCVLLSALLLGPVGCLAESKFISGFDYSSGSYGDAQDTDILFLPLTYKYTAEQWSAKVTVPFLQISGPSNVIGGVDGAEVLDFTSDELNTVTGLGDVVVVFDWMVDTRWEGAPWVDLIAKLKIPTADEDQGLGTGAPDLQGQVDLTHTYGRLTPFVSLGKKWRGDTAEVERNNQLYGSVGSDLRLVNSHSLGLIYDYRERSRAGLDPRSEAMLYWNWKLSPVYAVNLYTVKGFSDASPDWGVGSQFSWSPQ